MDGMSMSAIVYASTMIGVRPNVVAPAQRGRPYDHMNRCMFAPTSNDASHVYHIIRSSLKRGRQYSFVADMSA
jgi:hypothetical protein